MRTPSSSARLLKSKLFQSPARGKGALMKRCSPHGRRGSKFDINNLLSKSPRSSNLRSKYHHTATATTNGFSMKRLLELTPRTKRARSSSAVTPELSKHKRKSSMGSDIRGSDTVTRRSLFRSLPEQSATGGDVLMKASPVLTVEGEVHQVDTISVSGEDNHLLLPTLEANVKAKFPSLQYCYILLSESSEIEGGNCWLEVVSPSIIIHPAVGPTNCARIIVSDMGIYQIQVLFPFSRTVTKGKYCV